MKLGVRMGRSRLLRRHSAVLILGALAAGALSAGVIGVSGGTESVGPELVGAARQPAPAVGDALACDPSEPGVAGHVDHLQRRPGVAPGVATPTSPDQALDDFLRQRFPGLRPSAFSVVDAVPDVAHVYGLGGPGEERGRITVSNVGSGVWRVTGFDLCHSVYAEYLEGSR